MQNKVFSNSFCFLGVALLALTFSLNLQAQTELTIWKGDVKITYEKEMGAKENVSVGQPFELMIEKNGLVMGRGGPGCQIEGEVVPPPLASALSISANLLNCSDRRLNGKYTGTVKVRPDRQGSLSLSSIRPFRMEVVQISGDVTR